MKDELASVRYAQHLLTGGRSADEIVCELRVQLGLASVDALATVAAAMLLNDRGPFDDRLSR